MNSKLCSCILISAMWWCLVDSQSNLKIKIKKQTNKNNNNKLQTEAYFALLIKFTNLS